MEKERIILIIFIGVIFAIASISNIVGFAITGVLLFILWIIMLFSDCLNEYINQIDKLEKRIKKLEKNNG